MKYNLNEIQQKYDFLGYKLEDVIIEFNDLGIEYEVFEIFPKSKKEIIGELRVIKQQTENNKYILTVCKIIGFKDIENAES